MHPADILHGSYDYGLVTLSLVIASCASYIALDLAGRTTAAHGRTRSLWLAGGSISMGLGIWCMHYIGMLAFSLPVPVLYDLPTVFVSLLAAILASAVALVVVSRQNITRVTLLAGSAVMGGGIAAMHYIGMAAMRMDAMHHYLTWVVLLSILVAVVVSFAALSIAFHLRGETREFSPRKLGAAAIMGFAIASMHYTGMFGVVFTRGPMHGNAATAVSISSLGTAAVAVATIMVLAIVVLLAVVDRRFAAQAAQLRGSAEQVRQLSIEKQAAEAASHAKTVFLATVSHEIRTPMNALIGLQELLSLTQLLPEQREWLQLMSQSSRDLLHLIDDILDFSKIEAGKLDLDTAPTAIRPLVQGVCDTFGVLARNKGLHLDVELPAALPEVVLTDPLRLRQILRNLLSNAIKFTPAGGVRVRAVVSEVDGAQVVGFQIIDTGIGMPPEMIARCGEPFQQADAGMARRYGGSGLGLAICKRLCDLMHGSLHIESTQQVGTRITVQLPLTMVAEHEQPFRPEASQPFEAVAQPPKPSTPGAMAAGRSILVVDDHPTNLRLLVQQLEWLGYTCESFGDARAALARFVTRLAAGIPFAMTITDCQMPDMDGYALAREIRRAEVGNSQRSVLLAFTADVSRSLTELTTAFGFDGVLGKPVSLMSLKAQVERLLPVAPSLVPLPEPSARPGGPLRDRLIQAEFSAAHEEDLEMLRLAERTRDAVLAARAAHRIRGAARMVDAADLADSATRLGEIVRGGDWDQIGVQTRLVYLATQRLYAALAEPSGDAKHVSGGIEA
jgi:signal transduction histidine kinase/CheY-like chemotaxis protein